MSSVVALSEWTLPRVAVQAAAAAAEPAAAAAAVTNDADGPLTGAIHAGCESGMSELRRALLAGLACMDAVHLDSRACST